MSALRNPNVQRPNSLACTKCRAKHLKCDAKTPVCGRCQKNGLTCCYIRSRRGLRGRGDDEAVEVINQDSAVRGPADPLVRCNEFDESNVMDFGLANGSSSVLLNPLAIPSLSSAGPSHSRRRSELSPRSLNETQIVSSESLVNENEVFIDLFFTHIHATHPFIVPRRIFRQKCWTIPENLRTAVVFAGSHFTEAFTSCSYREKAVKLLEDRNPEDGYQVQALLLLALVFHARFEEHDCLAAFGKAVDLALKLRMFEETYATLNDFGDPVIAESWRRTWWELVAVDVLLPTFHPRQYESRLQEIETKLYLPSEESEYANCRIPSPIKTREHFSKRLFLEDDYRYSSYSYKIEAVCLLHLAQRSNAEIEDTLLRSIDSSLSNFLLSLPAEKREAVGVDGSVDEVLFSAHLIINMACVLFYRAQSNFALLGHRQPTQCTMQERPKLATCAIPQHTSKALRAANNLSDAVGAHLALKRRSPFLTCAVALACSIHLPAYILPSYATERPVLKERLQLSISALQMMGEIWTIAQVVKAQVSKFAREVLFDAPICSVRDPLELELQCMSALPDNNDESWLDYLPDSGIDNSGGDLSLGQS